MNLYALSDMKRLLEEYGFFFKKNLGQNFLLNENVASRIAEAARETIAGDTPCLAIEIGPGAGALTLQLSHKFDRVLALEIDPHLIPVLSESLSTVNNVDLVCCDALKYSFSDLPRLYPDHAIAVCSNLPYYLTTELLMLLLESKVLFSSITVLIQLEAADRLTATPGSEQYGAISASVSYYAEAKKLFRVGPGNFFPRPKVDSAVLRLTPREAPPVSPKSEPLFFAVIRAAFSTKRKTILNALTIAFNDRVSKEQILSVLDQCGIEPSRRGETLCLQDFCNISDHMFPMEDAT